MLGGYSRLDVEMNLDRCKLVSAGISDLAEVLLRNQGPRYIDSCDFDNYVLANGLHGNGRLKSLRPRLSSYRDVGNQELFTITCAL